MFELYEQNQANIESGDLSLLADTHASSSGLKSLTTLYASDAIEVCRKACGGHGYSMASVCPSSTQTTCPTPRGRATRTCFRSQCTRYLFKTMRAIKSGRGKVDKNITTDYMQRYLDNKHEKAAIQFSGDLYDPLFFMRAFGHRAAYLTEQTLALRDDAKRSWNSLLVELYRCSKAHSQYLLCATLAWPSSRTRSSTRSRLCARLSRRSSSSGHATPWSRSRPTSSLRLH